MVILEVRVILEVLPALVSTLLEKYISLNIAGKIYSRDKVVKIGILLQVEREEKNQQS